MTNLRGASVATRDQIIAALSRLVRRRRRVRRVLAIESLAALVGGIASLLAPPSLARFATAALAVSAAMLAGHDWQQLRDLRLRIRALARVIAPFV
jgi:hypothetical protein